jgi:sec-independent protein translocase protein TatB
MNGTILGIGPLEILAIAILILLVFGPERVPSLMRDLGRNVRKLRQYYVAFSTELKKEMEPFQEDIKGIQEAAEGLREDLAAIREAADLRGMITASDLEPAKPLETQTQTIAPPAVTESMAANGTAPHEAPSVTTAEAPTTAAPAVAAPPVSQPAYPPAKVLNGAGVDLGDDNPWAQVQYTPRMDRLDDDNPWAS